MPSGYVPSSTPYAVPSDIIKFGMTAAALSTPATDNAAQLAAILGASEVADSYLRQQFQLPLVQWGTDIVEKVCWMAQYTLINLRGFNPESAADLNYLEKYKLAKKWFEDVAAGRVTPNVTSSASGAQQGAQDPYAQPNDYSPNLISPNSTGCSTRGTNKR